MCCRYIFTNFPPLSSFLSLCPTQGHPTKTSNIHSYTHPTTWIQKIFNKGPHSKCILIPLHAFFSIAWTSFFSSSILIINPLYNLFLPRTYCFQILLFILPSIVLLSNPPFNIIASLAIIARCQSILHNAQTNKTSYPCSQVFLKQ